MHKCIFMKNKTFLIVFCSIVFSLTFISSGLFAGTYAIEYSETDSALVSADGPYVLYLEDGSTRVITVDGHGTLRDTTYQVLPENFSLSVTSSNGDYHFQVPLHPIKRPLWRCKQSNKIFVTSDPHGDLDCFVSLLQGNGIIDENLRWIYGTNHLMIIGDVFDRGDDVLPVFWLIYKLEEEAAQMGGRVSFLLGNHEPMVLANDLRYCTPKYHTLAERLSIPYSQLFGNNTELGRWLAARNTIQIIGKNLYVHAGLSEEFYEWNLSIPTVNKEISRALFMGKKERKDLSELTAFLYGNSGPIWYRGMVRDATKYNPISFDKLKKILKRYHVKRIIVGHTIFEDVSTFHDERVIDVNVNNSKNRDNGLGRGLLIEGDKYMKVGDCGIQRVLW